MQVFTDVLHTLQSEPSLFRSDLERLLQDTYIPTELLMRASAFRREVVRAGLTRIPEGEGFWRRPVNHNRVILVVGDAEKTAFMPMGEPTSRRNLVLLKAICQSNADAYIVYKPHPEVWASMQAQGPAAQHMTLWCDECVGDVPLAQLLPKVNEVHVMSSLAGFEALLKGKKVSCYGQTFYAGWGLTHDMVPMLERPRQITLDELVAAVMISYPHVFNRIATRIHLQALKEAEKNRLTLSGRRLLEHA